MGHVTNALLCLLVTYFCIDTAVSIDWGFGPLDVDPTPCPPVPECSCGWSGLRKDSRGCLSRCDCPNTIVACPHPYCPWRCPYGFRYIKENGCRRCLCKTHPVADALQGMIRMTCAKPICPAKCPYGTRYIKDKNGCTSCVCDKCPPKPKCPAKCPPGSRFNHIMDNFGCRRCKCKHCAKPICPAKCPHGSRYIKYKNGCSTCVCKCPSKMKCPAKCLPGYRLDHSIFSMDDFGCRRCKCKRVPLTCLSKTVCSCGIAGLRKDFKGCYCACPKCSNPQVNCPAICPLGNRYIKENGCRRCVCKINAADDAIGHICPKPICPAKCQYGSRYIKDKDGCTSCVCQPKCPPKPECPPMCPSGYRYAYTMDSFRCLRCMCKFDDIWHKY